VIWILIGIGGAIGAVSRHALNRVIMAPLSPGDFPLGILVINVVGSGLIGIIAGHLSSARVLLSDDMRVFLMVGVLGGFTTFSSFSLDTFALIRAGHMALALANVCGQVGLSLLAVVLGYRVGLRW
jgi:fluoride exporter